MEAGVSSSPSRGEPSRRPSRRTSNSSRRPGLKDNGRQADYIVIGHPDILDLTPGGAADNWISHRESAAGGAFNVEVVWIQDVVDEFNDGIWGPEAVQEFLRWVMSTEAGEGWADPKPTHAAARRMRPSGTPDAKTPATTSRLGCSTAFSSRLSTTPATLASPRSWEMIGLRICSSAGFPRATPATPTSRSRRPSLTKPAPRSIHLGSATG